MQFISSAKLKASNVKKVKLPENFYCFYDHSSSETSYAEDREYLAETLGYCKNLEYVDAHTDSYDSRDGIVYSNDYYDEYGDYDLNNMHRLIFVPPMVSSYTFPSDIKFIDGKAFYRNQKITSLTVPSTVEQIGYNAFQDCFGLKKIVIKDSNIGETTLRDELFSGCKSLESVTLPAGYTYFGSRCFYNCSSLKSINLPNAGYIGKSAFAGCTSLENAELGKRLYQVDDEAFIDTPKLKSLTIPETIQELSPGSVGVVYNEETGGYSAKPGFILYCYPGVGEAYAKEYGIDYELLAKAMKDAKIKLTKGTKYTYTGKALKPPVKVTYNGKALKEGTDYKLIYKLNKTPGRGYVVVWGLNKFSGKVRKYFYIYPAQTKVKKVTSPKKKAVKLYWKKDKTATGYQIFVSYNKNFKKKAKTVFVKRNSVGAKTITGLKSKKRCYVKIRSYYDYGAKRLYGKCSKTLSVVTK